MALQFLQQFSGTLAVSFYAPVILRTYFGETSALVGATVINVVFLVSTVLSMLIIERYGRVRLLGFSGLALAATHVGLAVLSSLGRSEATGYAVEALACAVFFFFAVGWGPVVWTACAELFPAPLRAKGTAVTTCTNWVTATAIGYVFPIVAEEHLNAAFAVFAAAMLGGATLVYLCLPETSGSPELADYRCRTHVVAFPRRPDDESIPAREG